VPPNGTTVGKVCAARYPGGRRGPIDINYDKMIWSGLSWAVGRDPSLLVPGGKAAHGPLFLGEKYAVHWKATFCGQVLGSPDLTDRRTRRELEADPRRQESSCISDARRASLRAAVLWVSRGRLPSLLRTLVPPHDRRQPRAAARKRATSEWEKQTGPINRPTATSVRQQPLSVLDGKPWLQ